jgi:ABC-type phosphate transport system substrate-binding protein
MRRLLLSALTVTMLATPAAVAGESSAAYEVIVNPANPNASVDRRFLAEAFLKKTTEWPNGELIRPVDLPPGSAVRRRFSEDVMRRTVSEVKTFWQQRIFSGRGVPPPELDTDDEVVTYVLKYGGAVGYVSGRAAIGNAKVVSVQ